MAQEPKRFSSVAIKSMAAEDSQNQRGWEVPIPQNHRSEKCQSEAATFTQLHIARDGSAIAAGEPCC